VADVDELLRAALIAAGPFADLVGGAGDAAKLYFDEPPKVEQLPLTCIHQIPADGEIYHLDGRLNLSQWWRQVDCWATTPRAARQMRAALRSAAGPLAGLTAPPLQVFIRRNHGGSEVIKGVQTDRTMTLFRASLDLQLWLTESD
jgi:hypothetical protein